MTTEHPRDRLPDDVIAWCRAQGARVDDPRLRVAARILPPEIWGLALDTDAPQTVLRWIGDPGDPKHPFWAQVTPSPAVAGPLPGDSRRTCYLMSLSDLLAALRATRLAARLAKLTSEARDVPEGDANAEIERREGVLDEIASDLQESREERLDRQRIDDNSGDDCEDDDGEPNHAEDRSTGDDEEIEDADRGAEDEASMESPYDDDDELERVAADELEHDAHDPVRALLERVRHVLGALAAAETRQRARPAEVLAAMDALELRRCPRAAAWQLAKGQVELRAALAQSPRAAVNDFVSWMIHIYKGVEILLADQFLEPIERLRRRGEVQFEGELNTLGSYAKALRAVADVRTHIGATQLRSQPEQVLANPTRLEWIAACASFLAAVLRNGYTHRHRAGERPAQRLLRVVLGDGGLVEFLLRREAVTPSDWLRAEVSAGGKAEPEADAVEVTLETTPSCGVIADGRFYGWDELRPAEPTAYARDDGLDPEDGEPATQVSGDRTTRREGDADEVFHIDDVGFEPGVGNVIRGRWPSVQVQAIVTAADKGPKTLDLGQLTSSRSTLTWRCVPERVQIVWGTLDALRSSQRKTVRLQLRDSEPG